MSKKNQVVSITKSAQSAGALVTRFAAVETEATRIHQEQSGASLVRALLKGGRMHAVISDECGSTIEVSDGNVMLSVSKS